MLFGNHISNMYSVNLHQCENLFSHCGRLTLFHVAQFYWRQTFSIAGRSFNFVELALRRPCRTPLSVVASNAHPRCRCKNSNKFGFYSLTRNFVLLFLCLNFYLRSLVAALCRDDTWQGVLKHLPPLRSSLFEKRDS